MASSIETGLTLPLVGHLYDHTGTAFKRSFRLLNTPSLSLAINGQGASALTLELGAALSGGNATPAKGDILTLTEEGRADASVVFKGIVEDFPDERGSNNAHEILVNPVGVQLGDTPFTTNYAAATDIGQMARDIVSACPNLSWDSTSIPLTGSTAIFDFSGTQSYTCLTALEELRKIAGVNFYYWPDTLGKVWFLAANVAGAATHSIMVAPGTEARKYSAPVSNRKNIINGYGAVLAGATAPITATYDNSAGSPLGKRVLVPPLTYSDLTDLTTLQNIVNTVGSVLDRDHVTVELDLVNYSKRVQPGDVLRYFEETVNERTESAGWPTTGAYSPNYVVLQVTQSGPRQSVVASDVPTTLDDLKYLIDSMIARTASGAVAALTAGSTGTVSPVMIGSTAPSTPAAPTLATAVERVAQADNADVTVSWLANPVGDYVSNYKVRWRQGSGPYAYIDAGGGSLTLVVRGLAPGTSYGFSVAAVNALGNLSAYSTEQTIVTATDASAPATPAGLSAIKTPRGALVSWNGNAESDLQGYELQVKIGSGSYTLVTPGPTLVTSLAYVAPSGTAQGTSLQFEVRALDWSGNASAWSAASTAVNTDGIVFDELLAGNMKVFGTITTGGLQTAASGARVVLDSTSLRIYDGSATNYGAPSGAGVTAELKNDGTAFFKGTISASSVYGSTIATSSTVGTTGNAGFKLSGQFLDFFTIGSTSEGNRYWFAPDSVTAFSLAGELAAATTTFNPPADSYTSAISGLGAKTVVRKLGLLNSFKKSGSPTLVGAAGALTTGATSVTPPFGQATTAGNTIVLIVAAVGNASSFVQPSGYTSVDEAFDPADNSAVWVYEKANCGAGETAPTFSVPLGTKVWGQVTEWSGLPTTTPNDRGKSFVDDTASTSVTVENRDDFLEPLADLQSGELVIGAVLWRLSGATTATITDTFNNATATTLATDAGTSLADHVHFSYGITSWGTVATAEVLQLTNFLGFELVTTGADNNNARGLILSQYSNDVAGALITLRKAKGTLGAPLAIDSTGDIASVIHADAYDGSAWVNFGKLGFSGTYIAPGKIQGEFGISLMDSTGQMGPTQVLISPTAMQMFGATLTGSDGSLQLSGPLIVPPASNNGPATTSYGTVPVKIDEATPTTNSFSFSSIPTGFRALMVTLKANSSHATAAQAILLTLNADSAVHYDWSEMSVNAAGGAVSGIGGTGATSMRISVAGKTGDPGMSGVLWLPGYASATPHNVTVDSYRKDVSFSGRLSNGGFYNQSVAVNSLTFTLTGGANFQNAEFTLWGIP